MQIFSRFLFLVFTKIYGTLLLCIDSLLCGGTSQLLIHVVHIMAKYVKLPCGTSSLHIQSVLLGFGKSISCLERWRMMAENYNPSNTHGRSGWRLASCFDLAIPGYGKHLGIKPAEGRSPCPCCLLVALK